MPTRITDPKKDIALLNKALNDLDTLQGTVSDVQDDVTTLKGLPVKAGNGSPEGTVEAPVGTIYVRKDGGSGSTLYVKETGGAGFTGWVAK